MLPQLAVEQLNFPEQQLDDFLGNDFALIIQDKHLIENATEVSKSFFYKTQIKTIFIGQPPFKSSDYVTNLVPIEDSLLKKLRAHRDQIILIRPDRYVAASFSGENQKGALAKFKEILNTRGK